MSRKQKALVGLLVAAAAWLAMVVQLLRLGPAVAAETHASKGQFLFLSYLILFSPLLFAVLLAMHAVVTIAWQTLHVEKDQEAAAALTKDLLEAKAALAKMGYKASLPGDEVQKGT